MKNIIQTLLALIFILLTQHTNSLFAQCTNTSSYGSATAGVDNTPVTISTCNWQTEYSTVSGIQAGETYSFDYDLGGCITIHEGSPSGPIVAWGNAPVSYTSGSGATLYIHYNTSCSTCGTATSCGTSTVTCTSCTGPPPPPGNTGCSGMEPICTNSGLNFTANTGISDASVLDPGNDYGCLFSQPNPTWYYFEVATAGNIDMSLSAASDIDFIIWGPFADLAAAQAGCGSLGQPGGAPEVDCSFSATSNETPSIPNAQVGEVYVMLITNYANVVQNITLNQTGGAGSTNCNIVMPCSADAGPDVVYCAGGPAVLIGNDPVTPDEGDTYSWNNGAGSGTIDLTGGGQDNGQATVAPGSTTTYIVTVTNIDGCVASDTVVVTVDNPPTASNPAGINAQCLADVPAPNPAVVTTESDDFTIPPIVTFISEVSDGNTCPETITRTYRVTDDCGNFVDVTQTITVNDTQAPVFSAPPANITVQCIGDVPAMTNLSWTDNCDGSGSVAGVDGALTGGTCGGTITRTWTYTDACGNMATETQTITINDTQAPVFSAPPANITVQCLADVPAMTNLSWTDNCDGSGSVAGSDGPLSGGTCGGTITRTWTFTDACGNTAIETQTITIDDTTPPTGSAPANVSVQCMADVPAVNTADITDEADNCTVAPAVTHISDVQSGGSCPITIDRTYRIMDDCGNFIDVVQTITVNDNTPPTGTAPANVSVECLADVPAADPLLITDEADNCTANPVVAFVNDVSDGNTCPEIITRTYSITDDCGNVTTVTQTITVDDTTPPTGTAPANTSVQCMADVPPVNTADITDEADNCTAVPTVTHISDVQSGGSCPITIDRTYRIMDNCGNFIDVVQTITVNDNIPPTGTAPANITVECVGDVPAADPLLITDEADNCTANPVVAFVNDVSDGNTCPETIIRTYTITDDCGNVTTVTQTIIVDDTTPPTATNPANINQSGGSAPAPDPAVVTDEADNCTANPVVAFVSDVSDGNTCPETITRTYSVTDDCGNQITVTQLIIIGDPSPPTGTAPADITVECIGDVPAADPLLITDEADNNGVPTVTHAGDVSDGNTCPETITRTYDITDACGNVTSVTQIITVDDTTPPTGTAPANVAVECIADVPAADPLLITDEADNCTTNPVVAFVSDVSDGNTCPETITRTYSITDDCGNSINVTQTITVDDITPPTGTAPANVTVECIADVPVADPLLITDEADNCTANPVVAHVSDVSDGNTCPETITRTYSITDDCGNVTTVTQTITVDDTTPPTATNPSSITVPGGPAPAPDPAVVTDEADNCTANPVVAFVSDVSDNNPCPETIIRTYSITDDCGNQITVTQDIIITDPILPTGTAPADITVECIGDVPPADPLLITDEADNSGVPTVAFVSDVSDGNTCPETITRTYSITDDCGNVVNVTQIITVDDTTSPTASNPAGISVECIADVPAADPSVVIDEADNCTANPVVAFVSDVSDGNTCPETITRTYSITDDCGNSINVTQTITVDDITPPTGTAPANVTVECIADVPVADPLLITDEADNCTANPVVAHVSDVSDGNTCPETITRTYSITDDCGNVTTVTQTITVDDTTPPTATNPSSITVPGGPAPAPDPAVVTDEADNCTANPVVAFVSDVSDNNPCPETIIRTYSITDDCGNQITVTQDIIITDPILPTGTAPADITVECIGDVPPADPLLITDEADNNGVPTVAFVSDVSDGNTCPETITRTYSITDDCGNVVNVTQIITVDDTTPPTGTAPANVTVECIADVPVADPLLITDEADNCTANPVVAFVSDVSDGNTCPETITRTYSITDDCGNF
ncbi:MAG: hypothetical protein HUJ25_12110, partial [Crocinitomicaceae bacterium]|nr:hypothetical protein [Crocinitomicaceae bacterium]